MNANGVQMPPASVQLTPQQAVVVAALERLMNHVGVEIQQLDGLWGQKAEASKLVVIHKAIEAQRNEFMQSCSKLIIAKEMPVIPGLQG